MAGDVAGDDAAESAEDPTEESVSVSTPHAEAGPASSDVGFRLSEPVLHAIDSQIISSGLRLILFLPAFTGFTFFVTWAFSSASPAWWADNIEPNLNMSFSVFLASISFVVLLGYTLAVGFHRYRVAMSMQAFEQRIDESNDDHRSVASLHGFDGLVFSMKQSGHHHNRSLLFAVLASFMLLVVLYVGPADELGTVSLLGAAALLVLSVGSHLPTRSTPFNMVDRTGLMAAYSPPVHPSTLSMVFNDLLKTHMDPLLRSEYDEYCKGLEGGFRKTVKRAFAHEKFLMTLYRHATGLDRSTMENELKEILTLKGMEYVFKHPVFTLEVWLVLMGTITKRSPAFFRMVDRLKQNLESGDSPAMEDLVFEVDMENVVTDRANLFTLFHNLSDQPRTVVFRVQTPNFLPKDVALTYRLEPGQRYWWSTKSLPLAQKGNEDVLGKMSGLLMDSTVSWQTLVPISNGDATVSVRLEETNGELLLGRQINVRVRAEFSQWLRRTGAIMAYVLGGCGVLVSSVMISLQVFGITG